ncbi:ABC transporter permease [Actinomadura rugatobispora]|uniref:ABC transporter permease n=1 Tax=Actinomadura rugatobispora TaxID=1994 RepID=A0ABW1AFB3_9ACTN|nr:ABC transporter permease [Actinomadura rugatobispora]
MKPATTAGAGAAAPVRTRKRERPAARRALRGAWIGLGMLVLLFGGALAARFGAETDAIDVDAVLKAPSAEHWFGTDSSGRDVFVRTLAAGAADLPIALGGTLVALLAGTLLGLVAGTRNRFAEPIMRLVDGFQAFPLLILILVIVQISGGGTAVLVLTIAILNMPRFIRLTRAEALHIRESRYVFFAEVIGARRGHVLRRHILPNVSGAVLSQASVGGALALGAIGAMSFLGLGIAPPTPSWGAMVQSGATGITGGQWWPVLFPSLALVWAIVAFNLIADSLDAYFAKEIQ